MVFDSLWVTVILIFFQLFVEDLRERCYSNIVFNCAQFLLIHRSLCTKINFGPFSTLYLLNWAPGVSFVGVGDGLAVIYQNFNYSVFTCQPAVKSIFGSLSWFHLSIGCQRHLFCRNNAKLSWLYERCKGVELALNSTFKMLLFCFSVQHLNFSLCYFLPESLG